MDGGLSSTLQNYRNLSTRATHFRKFFQKPVFPPYFTPATYPPDGPRRRAPRRVSEPREKSPKNHSFFTSRSANFRPLEESLMIRLCEGSRRASTDEAEKNLLWVASTTYRGSVRRPTVGRFFALRRRGGKGRWEAGFRRVEGWSKKVTEAPTSESGYRGFRRGEEEEGKSYFIRRS